MSSKHPNYIGKGHRIESPRELCVSLIVVDYLAVRSLPKHEIRGLEPLVYSPIFTLLNFHRGMEVDTTRDVTTRFWPRQDGHQFWAQPADFKRLKI